MHANPWNDLICTLAFLLMSSLLCGFGAINLLAFQHVAADHIPSELAAFQIWRVFSSGERSPAAGY